MSNIAIYVHEEDKDWVYISVWLLNFVMENYEWILILEMFSVHYILKMISYVHMVCKFIY